MINKKHTIITALITTVVISTAYLGYVFYKEIGIVQEDHATLNQVVNFLNQANATSKPK
jgi:hypothetical protein